MIKRLAVLLLCLAPLAAQAKPSRLAPVDQFVGDRYAGRIAQGMTAREVTTVVRHKARKGKRAPPPRPGYVSPLTLAQGIQREAVQVIGGRPAGCPHRFCGCGASIHVFGRIIPALNLAANWLRFPRAEPAPNMVAARRGHVFVLKEHIAGNVWRVFDANSGRGRIRIHPRSIAGFAIVNPRA